VTRPHRGSLDLFFRNILRDGHKNILFLTLVPQEIFVITIITKALELAFNHFFPGSIFGSLVEWKEEWE
jgi:hypothetical protein